MYYIIYYIIHDIYHIFYCIYIAYSELAVTSGWAAREGPRAASSARTVSAARTELRERSCDQPERSYDNESNQINK